MQCSDMYPTSAIHFLDILDLCIAECIDSRRSFASEKWMGSNKYGS